MKTSYLMVLLVCINPMIAYSDSISQFQRIEGNTIFFDVPVSINDYPLEQVTIAIENANVHENYPFFSPVPLEVVFSIDEGVHALFHVSITYCNYDGDTSDCVSLGEDIHKLVNQHKLQKLVMRKK